VNQGCIVGTVDRKLDVAVAMKVRQNRPRCGDASTKYALAPHSRGTTLPRVPFASSTHAHVFRDELASRADCGEARGGKIRRLIIN
jgi:hypothetical protein